MLATEWCNGPNIFSLQSLFEKFFPNCLNGGIQTDSRLAIRTADFPVPTLTAFVSSTYTLSPRIICSPSTTCSTPWLVLYTRSWLSSSIKLIVWSKPFSVPCKTILCLSIHTLYFKRIKMNKQASRSGGASDLMWEAPRSNISYPEFFWMCGFFRFLQLNVRMAFPLGHSHFLPHSFQFIISNSSCHCYILTQACLVLWYFCLYDFALLWLENLYHFLNLRDNFWFNAI